MAISPYIPKLEVFPIESTKRNISCQQTAQIVPTDAESAHHVSHAGCPSWPATMRNRFVLGVKDEIVPRHVTTDRIHLDAQIR